MSKQDKKPGSVLLIAHHSRLGNQTRSSLVEAGFEVLTGEDFGDESTTPEVIVVVTDGDEADLKVLSRRTKGGEYPPPVIVFGPERTKRWRRRALEAGAFACLSNMAKREDKVGLVAAASRFRALQHEAELIRREADTVMQELLTSYGTEAVRLKRVLAEARAVRESLEEVQTRIIRSML